MQKKAENKLAAFQAVLDKNMAGAQGSEVERLRSNSEDEVLSNGNWEAVEEGPRQWTPEQGDWNPDPYDMRQLHVSLEHIKKRVQSIHNLSDNKNVTEPLSSEEEEVPDFEERAAVVEWERKKLKNKLVELQEKKKKNDELLKELSFLKDAAVMGSFKNSKDDSNLLTPAPKEPALDTRKKTLQELQATLSHLRDMMMALSPDANTQETQEEVPSSSQSNVRAKRDNVRKEQNAGFPARRHYEAEGRANEDPDVPPPADDNSWQDNPRIQEKLRKLQEAKDRLRMIQNLMTTIQDAKQNGKQVPKEHLAFLTALEEQERLDDASDMDQDSEDSEQENNVAESNNESAETQQKMVLESERPIQNDVISLESGDLADLIRERDELTKLHDQFLRLRQMFPSAEKKTDDCIRSSGEGGNTQKRKPLGNAPVDNHTRPKLRQDNLQLTRQNIATMESQNRSAPTRDGGSVKKDNINNLSGKMSVPNAVNGSETSRDNLDSVSTFSTDMNPSLMEVINRKSVMDLLKHGKHKSRNQECSNSSMDSEPLSNSALAPDTTVAATWGGSSTQENFEDEAIGSLEDEEPDGNGAGLIEARNGQFSIQFSNPFSNIQPYMDLDPNITEKHKNCKQIEFKRPVNSGKNFSSSTRPKSSQQSHSSSHTENTMENVGGHSSEVSQPSTGTLDAAADYHLRMSSRFIQQLRDQIEQLNALCQQRFFHDRPINPAHPVASSYPPLQLVPDIMYHNNQQLLLSLSQCYHALYMQQFEIQHLQRCLRQNVDPEGHAPEELSLPPWFPANQPVAFPFGPPVTQPVRAVVHPAGQENRTSETLNNQVPPRTRANNFWDNFRSYSRQNLLSTSSNTKRNENVGFSVAPQIRQVHPLVAQESLSNQRTRDSPHSDGNIATAPQVPYRPLANTEVQHPSKKANAGLQGSTPLGRHPQTVPVTRIARNTEPPSANINFNPVQADSKIRSFPTVLPLTEANSENLSSSQSSHQSDFLIGLFHEFQNFKSDKLRQKALNVIRDLARSENAAEAEVCPQKKSKIENSVTKTEPANEQPADVTEASGFTEFPRPPETSLQWTAQNLPTAAITPLGKHVTTKSVSTGAIKKKQISRTLHSCSHPSTSWDGPPAAVQDISARPEEAIMRKVVTDLIPYICSQVPDEACPLFRANICSRIVDILKANAGMPLPGRLLPPLHRALDRLLAKYSGLRWCDIETDFLKTVAEFLFRELASFKATGQFTFPDDEAPLSDLQPQPDVLPLQRKPVGEKRRMPVCKNSQEESNASDINSYFLQQESEDQAGEVKMLAEEAATFPMNLNCVLQPDYEAVSSENSYGLQPVRPVPAEEDYECEPEVEAGTEADLAEADQSPGQQGADSWPLLPPNEDEMPSCSQMCPEMMNGEQEVTLDDIPTKLSPLSEEELQRQMKEEQASNVLALDVVEDLGLAGDSDAVRDPAK